MWAEIHHRRYAVDSFDRLPILSSSIHDFSATYIDHTLASALLFKSSGAQVGDSVLQIHQLREREEQEGANHERDVSKTDKPQSLRLPHTPSSFCHARKFGLSRRALARPWG